MKRAPLGDSDHYMIHLVPAHRQQLKREKPTKHVVPQWKRRLFNNYKAVKACTDWSVFTDSAEDLDDVADVMIDYMRFCDELCIPRETDVISK